MVFQWALQAILEIRKTGILSSNVAEQHGYVLMEIFIKPFINCKRQVSSLSVR